MTIMIPIDKAVGVIEGLVEQTQQRSMNEVDRSRAMVLAAELQTVQNYVKIMYEIGEDFDLEPHVPALKRQIQLIIIQREQLAADGNVEEALKHEGIGRGIIEVVKNLSAIAEDGKGGALQ